MPIGGLLISVRHRKNEWFVEGRADQLHANGQTVFREPAWHRDRRRAEMVERARVAMRAMMCFILGL